MEDGLNDSYKSGSHLGFELIKKISPLCISKISCAVGAGNPQYSGVYLNTFEYFIIAVKMFTKLTLHIKLRKNIL